MLLPNTMLLRLLTLFLKKILVQLTCMFGIYEENAPQTIGFGEGLEAVTTGKSISHLHGAIGVEQETYSTI